MTYSWETADPKDSILESLQALAGDVSYLGRSSSQVRFMFHREFASLEDRPVVPTGRSPYQGYFDELEGAFQSDQKAPRGVSVPPPTAAPRHAPSQSVFGPKWVIYSDAQARRPDLRRTTNATKALRTAILSTFGGQDAPQVFSGHRGDTGQPIQLPHMAIFPLANVGWPKAADGPLMGLAVCLPRHVSAGDEEMFLKALAQLHRDSDVARRGGLEILVKLSNEERWLLARQPEPTLSSLRPERYVRASTTWTTVTPIVLQKQLPGGNPEEQHNDISRQLRLACQDIGLPIPQRVIAHSNSAVTGSPPVAAPQRGFRSWRKRNHRKQSPDSRNRRAPRPWELWDTPPYLRELPLTHATLQWDHLVEGPIALGSGRFVGLGLCVSCE